MTLSITLNSAKLANPDLDLRYELPDFLERESKGAIRADGYDYLPDGQGDTRMVVFGDTGWSQEETAAFLQGLTGRMVLGNTLWDGMLVAYESQPAPSRAE